MAKKSKKIVIIDSNALLHRAWHIMPPLKTKDGVMVNAVYGFTTLLLKIIKELKPDYVVAAFDLAGKTFRHEKYHEYKAQRVKQADEFYEQIPLTKEVLAAFHIPVLTKTGYEADDIIGTIATDTATNHKDVHTYIVTSDLDTLQLVNKSVHVITLQKGFSETMEYDDQAVKNRFGLTPKQFIDFKAIKGDASDNIKGVSGIGEKGAGDLIKQFGSLENLYKKLDMADIKERTRKLLSEQKKQAFESKELVTIVTDVPLKWKISDAAFADFDADKVYEIFQRLEFNSLLNKIPNQKNAPKKPVGLGSDANYQIISEKKEFDDFLKKLSEQSEFVIDTETTGLNVMQADLLGLSFSWQDKLGYYINVSDEKFQKYCLEKLKSVLENPKVGKIGHNLKYDYKILALRNIKIQGITFDTLLAAYLINSERGLRLEELAFSYFGYKKLKLEDLLDHEPKKKKDIDVANIPVEKLGWYSAEDADITWRLYNYLLPKVKKTKDYQILQDIELPLIEVLSDMELAGVCLDSSFLHKMEKQFDADIKKISQKIYKLAGQEFNISSPLQLKEILFNKLKIASAGIKKTKTGLSTAASELEKMKDAHPIIPLIGEYRELTKLQSTYIIALPNMVDPKTKRVHTNYNQTIAATGRLSSTDPNLQNIPIRTELGRKIRHAFVAPSGNVLLSADYSQIELRLAAVLSKDPKMLEAFKKNEDIHARTAAEIHKIPLEEVTKEIRRTAKEVNFGILYGLGSTGLAQRTDMNRAEAKEFIEKYFGVYKKIKVYIEAAKHYAHEHGYIETIFGRRRHLPDINSSMPMLRAAAERMAINMPLQGTAADLMKMAMIAVWKGLSKISPESKMILQVHDELVLEVPQNDLDKVAKFVKQAMQSVYTFPIPLMVDVEQGQNWDQLEKIEI